MSLNTTHIAHYLGFLAVAADLLDLDSDPVWAE